MVVAFDCSVLDLGKQKGDILSLSEQKVIFGKISTRVEIDVWVILETIVLLLNLTLGIGAFFVFFFF